MMLNLPKVVKGDLWRGVVDENIYVVIKFEENLGNLRSSIVHICDLKTKEVHLLWYTEFIVKWEKL